jgi:hypothetical protein
MPLQAVTPEELDEWLKFTKVTKEEDEDSQHKVRPIDSSSKQGQSSKKKVGSWRRRSSLDEDGISARPCFGVDASAILADVSQEESLRALHPKRTSSSSSSVIANNHHLHSSDRQAEMNSFKKRRVSCPPNDRNGNSQYVPQLISHSHGSHAESGTPYSRLVTDDSCRLDREAALSPHYSQFASPSHTMDTEARYSRRSSQFTTFQTQNCQGSESFLRAMEVSQRSHKMLMNYQFPSSVEERGMPLSMRDSAETRSLLVRLIRRSIVNSMETRQNRSSLSIDKMSRHNRVAAYLRKMENMLLAEQEQMS